MPLDFSNFRGYKGYENLEKSSISLHESCLYYKHMVLVLKWLTLIIKKSEEFPRNTIVYRDSYTVVLRDLSP
jgi:hypothetical protein